MKQQKSLKWWIKFFIIYIIIMFATFLIAMTISDFIGSHNIYFKLITGLIVLMVFGLIPIFIYLFLIFVKNKAKVDEKKLPTLEQKNISINKAKLGIQIIPIIIFVLGYLLKSINGPIRRDNLYHSFLLISFITTFIIGIILIITIVYINKKKYKNIQQT